MSAPVVKFDKNSVYTFFENFYGFRLSSFESARKNLREGKVVFSLKTGKRRKLIKGNIIIEMESSRYYDGLKEVYYFTPNNQAKFLSVFQPQKDQINE